jgi:hypothetical protein
MKRNENEARRAEAAATTASAGALESTGSQDVIATHA